MDQARYTILTMMKDEGPALLEWLAFHRLIGVDRVIVYTNDCRDGTDAMLDRLQAMGLAIHRRNDVPTHRAPQPHALTQGQKDAAVLATDWLIVMDADEFLHVKTGAGRIDDLIAACPDGTNGVVANWRMMGSNGHVQWRDTPVVTDYTRGAPDGFRKGWGVKTLFRPFADLKLGIHRPRLKGMGRDPAKRTAMETMAWVNGSGQPMPPSFLRDGWRGSAATVGRDLVEIAHFAVKSAEAFVMRGDRGNVNLKSDKYDATYFAVFDRNEEVHDGLARFAPEIDDLVRDWLSDPDLTRLHQQTQAWHKARIGALRTRADFADRMQALAVAARVPYDRLDQLLFPQPLAPKGKQMVIEMQQRGIPDAQIAAAVARSVAQLEARRDAAEAAELRAMGINVSL